MGMEKEVMDKYLKAGRICAEVRKKVESSIGVGMKLIDLANMVDNLISEKGGRPAFPVNISMNENAAHYTPPAGDTTEICEGDLVKVDIGVHIDGYIGDMAFTYCSEKNPLVDAVNNILADAIKVIKPGVTVSEIGSTIQGSAESNGVGLIVNLTGHTLDKYVFHGAPGIPNVKNDSKHAFQKGDVIALEPFTCKTNGFVKEAGGSAEIYRYVMDRPVRLMEARRILQAARDQYKECPFAKRWLYRDFSPVKVGMALRQLDAADAIESYPVLREVEGKPIAQAEHTIIVDDKPVVTTRIDDD
ncbi:MAG: type II methionyl aminopeptidase [Candidatus Aenigmatarchaeota archaeon]|nr:MAG: type II methionyl aminopeptidase [Candidatus Aenigmarchaeota archaeon]